MVALSELLVLFTTTNKILIQYHIVWLLVVIFCQRATREAMQEFTAILAIRRGEMNGKMPVDE